MEREEILNALFNLGAEKALVAQWIISVWVGGIGARDKQTMG